MFHFINLSLKQIKNPSRKINKKISWYQIKKILKINNKDDLEDFNEIYNTLGLKLRSMLYNNIKYI